MAISAEWQEEIERQLREFHEIEDPKPRQWWLMVLAMIRTCTTEEEYDRIKEVAMTSEPQWWWRRVPPVERKPGDKWII